MASRHTESISQESARPTVGEMIAYDGYGNLELRDTLSVVRANNEWVTKERKTASVIEELSALIHKISKRTDLINAETRRKEKNLFQISPDDGQISLTQDGQRVLGEYVSNTVSMMQKCSVSDRDDLVKIAKQQARRVKDRLQTQLTQYPRSDEEKQKQEKKLIHSSDLFVLFYLEECIQKITQSHEKQYSLNVDTLRSYTDPVAHDENTLSGGLKNNDRRPATIMNVLKKAAKKTWWLPLAGAAVGGVSTVDSSLHISSGEYPDLVANLSQFAQGDRQGMKDMIEQYLNGLDTYFGPDDQHRTRSFVFTWIDSIEDVVAAQGFSAGISHIQTLMDSGRMATWQEILDILQDDTLQSRMEKIDVIMRRTRNLAEYDQMVLQVEDAIATERGEGEYYAQQRELQQEGNIADETDQAALDAILATFLSDYASMIDLWSGILSQDVYTLMLRRFLLSEYSTDMLASPENNQIFFDAMRDYILITSVDQEYLEEFSHDTSKSIMMRYYASIFARFPDLSKAERIAYLQTWMNVGLNTQWLYEMRGRYEELGSDIDEIIPTMIEDYASNLDELPTTAFFEYVLDFYRHYKEQNFPLEYWGEMFTWIYVTQVRMTQVGASWREYQLLSSLSESQDPFASIVRIWTVFDESDIAALSSQYDIPINVLAGYVIDLYGRYYERVTTMTGIVPGDATDLLEQIETQSEALGFADIKEYLDILTWSNTVFIQTTITNPELLEQYITDFDVHTARELIGIANIMSVVDYRVSSTNPDWYEQYAHYFKEQIEQGRLEGGQNVTEFLRYIDIVLPSIFDEYPDFLSNTQSQQTVSDLLSLYFEFSQDGEPIQGYVGGPIATAIRQGVSLERIQMGITYVITRVAELELTEQSPERWLSSMLDAALSTQRIFSPDGLERIFDRTEVLSGGAAVVPLALSDPGISQEGQQLTQENVVLPPLFFQSSGDTTIAFSVDNDQPVLFATADLEGLSVSEIQQSVANFNFLVWSREGTVYLQNGLGEISGNSLSEALQANYQTVFRVMPILHENGNLIDNETIRDAQGQSRMLIAIVSHDSPDGRQAIDQLYFVYLQPGVVLDQTFVDELSQHYTGPGQHLQLSLSDLGRASILQGTQGDLHYIGDYSQQVTPEFGRYLYPIFEVTQGQ